MTVRPLITDHWTFSLYLPLVTLHNSQVDTNSADAHRATISQQIAIWRVDIETDINSLNIDQIRNEIIKFKNDVVAQRLESYYSTKSIAEIFGVSRKELAHSSFIAWLLNGQESHNLGNYPFIKFLEILVLSCRERQSESHKEFFDAIITGDMSVTGLQTVTEKSIENVGRVDILSEAKIEISGQSQRLRVVIENKVATKEHSDQTTKYFEHYESLENEDCINLYVFLTPMSGIALSELTEPECSCKEYIQINYQNLVDYLLEPILNMDASDKTKTIIREYLQTLSQPAQNEDDDEHKQGLIMAIGNDERELLTRFWDRNQKLILSALYAISSDPDQEKDVRESISTALDSISSGAKDRSLISIFFNDKLVIEKIKKSAIGSSTIQVLDENGLIDDGSLDFLKEDKSCSFDFLKELEDITENEVKYRRYRTNNNPELVFNGQSYYVARNWGIGNIQGFMEKISGRFPQIRYENH